MPYRPLIIIILFLLALLLQVFVFYCLYPFQIGTEPLFLFEVLGVSTILPYGLTIFINLCNIVFIWLIARFWINDNIALTAAFFYGISPWSLYLAAGGSSYILLLFSLLLSVSGLMLFGEQRKVGLFLFLAGILLSLSISLFMWLLVPLCLLILNYQSVYPKPVKAKILIPIISLFFILLVLVNPQAWRNSFNKQVSILPNSGVLNVINDLQGELIRKDMHIGKVIENRYSYFYQYTLLALLKNASPIIYFIPQNTFGFKSNTAPIFLGFLIPFLYGLNSWIKNWRNKKNLYLLLLPFFIPSLFSAETPNLTRLILISPVVFGTISIGLEQSLWQPKTKLTWFLFCLTITLVLVQLVIFLLDLYVREPVRLNLI